MRHLYLLGWLLLSSTIHAGVYGDLEFGDSRELVTKKLQQSPLVEQAIDETYKARTGLNGIYKCKSKIAGLACWLYFNWDAQGGLNEITLRSESLDSNLYETELKNAWIESSALFSRVYQEPRQQAPYPLLSSFKEHQMMISHVWENSDKTNILIGTGMV
ncbi:MAG: hypothetical protein P8P36_11455, partial [Akkermansiaceae bacterium]|nr:hypothetical protein [Akkermansiaceae bacterium]